MQRLGRLQQRRLDAGSQEAAAALQEQLVAVATNTAGPVAEETAAEAEARLLVPLWEGQPDRQQPMVHQSIHRVGSGGLLWKAGHAKAGSKSLWRCAERTSLSLPLCRRQRRLCSRAILPRQPSVLLRGPLCPMPRHQPYRKL